MKGFNECHSALVERVYEDDLQSQMHYLSVIEEHRKISVDYLTQRGCLFIPNNEYIKHYLGADATQFGLELYSGENCLWTLYYTFPVQDLTGESVGLVGWDAFNKFKETEGETGLSMYKVSSKNVFKKESYFLSDVNLLEHTFDSRVIFVTDGVFDSVSLNFRGIPAIALLGSTVSKEVLYFLSWYKYIYVCADNDRAGVKLYERLKSALPNVYRVYQSGAKDIEELLRSDGEERCFSAKLLSYLNSPIKGDIYLTPNKSFRGFKAT